MKFLANIQKNAMRIGMGTAGGVASRLVAGKVLPMIPVVKDHPKFHNGINVLLGAVAMDMTKGNDLGFGYAVVAGTDTVADFVPMFKPSGVAGLNEDINGLGEELADELEKRMFDDVGNANDAMNGDVNAGAMNDESGVSDDINEDLGGNDD